MLADACLVPSRIELFGAHQATGLTRTVLTLPLALRDAIRTYPFLSLVWFTFILKGSMENDRDGAFGKSQNEEVSSRHN